MMSSHRFEPGDVGTLRKFAYCLNERVPVNTGLPCTEILCRRLEDICEIELRENAETNAPSPSIISASFAAPEMTFSESPFR
jgi:hypothetical protein